MSNGRCFGSHRASIFMGLVVFGITSFRDHFVSIVLADAEIEYLINPVIFKKKKKY